MIQYLLKNKLNIFLSIICFVNSSLLFAEGSKTISPNSNNNTALAILPSIGSGSYFGCLKDNRIYFSIKDFTVENLYFGFDWRLYTPNIPNPSINNIYMKIFSPSGIEIGLPIQLPNTGAGYINSWDEANNGPNITGLNTLGYMPLLFTPTENGEFWIELYKSTDGGVSQMSGSNWSYAPFFDLTVSTNSGSIKEGRVFCNKWSLVPVDPTNFNNTPNATGNPTLYSYSTDKVVMEIDFLAGLTPIAYNVLMTKYGAQNTNNIINDRNSYNTTTNPNLEGEYKLFLNKPDSTIYSYSQIPTNPANISPIMIGCSAPFTIRYSLPDSGDVKLLLNFNGIADYQYGSSDLLIEDFNKNAGLNTYSWNGLDGNGNIVAANTIFSIDVIYLKGRYNLPLYDAEINTNGMKIFTVAPIVDINTKSFWNDANLVNIGTTCIVVSNNPNNITGTGSNNSIFGTISPMHAWNGNGNIGTVIPAPAVSANDLDMLQCNDFGNSRVINTWGWGITQKSTFSISHKCISISGTVWIDKNGSANMTNSSIYTANEVGTNLSGSLFATLIDPVTGLVLESVAINLNGTYTLSQVPTNGTNIEIRLTNTQGIENDVPPAIATLPKNWCKTSPFNQFVNTLSSDITGKDFGVYQILLHSDNFNVSQNIGLNANVSINDTTLANSSYSVVGNPLHGSISISSSGVYTYTPATNYYGLDSVKYRVCLPSPFTLCDTTTIIFNVISYNTVVATNDNASTLINSLVNICVKCNDTDPNGNTIGLPTIYTNPSHGTVIVKSNGTIDYTPTTSYIGTDVFQYIISDNGVPVAYDTAMVSITITKPQQDAIGDSKQTYVNTLVTGNASTNDTVVLNSSYSIIGSPLHGSITMSTTGTYTYTPTNNYNGLDSVKYIVCSPSPTNVCDTALITFTILIPNTVVATNDNASTLINSLVNICVKCNDTDPNGNTIGLPTIYTNPSHGTVIVKSNGTIDYTPTTSYIGTDVFQYIISDNGVPVAYDTAMVSITITKPQQDAIGDSKQTYVNTLVTGNASTNDTVVLNSSYSIIGSPLHGSITMSTTGTYTYTPTSNYNGLDSVKYRVCSPSPTNVCDTALITFTVLIPNTVVATNDNASTLINSLVNICVKCNDTDPNGNTIGLPTIYTNPSNGTVIVKSNGTIDYTPTTSYIGTDVFKYIISDNGVPVAYDTAMVSITITKPQQDAIGDSKQTYVNTLVTGNASTNDTVVLNSSYSIIGSPLHGSITMSTTGTYTYTPTNNYNGLDSVKYIVCSPSSTNVCDTALITFTILIPNTVVATNDNASTLINSLVNICVKCNDTDPNGNTIGLPTIYTNPSHGTVIVKSNGTIDYTPTTSYIGTDVFQYIISDNGVPVAYDTAMVSITITKPLYTIVPDINITEPYITVTGNVSINDNIIPGTTYELIGLAKNSLLIMDSSGSYIYKPDSTFVGVENYQYISKLPAPYNIIDTSILTFTMINPVINSVNSVVAISDYATTPINQSISICILCNDVDPQNNTIAMPIVLHNPLHGNITIASNGKINYSPTTNYVGKDYFTYIICDNGTPQACDTSVVEVNVTDLPLQINQTYANDDFFATIQDSNISKDVSLNDTDPQNDLVNYNVISNPTHGIVTMNTNGTFSYIPTTNYSGPDNFRYQKCDNLASPTCDTATVYLEMMKIMVALPVVLESFTTIENNCSVNLNWKTISEINFSHFEIERKKDGGDFEKIATISSNSIVTSATTTYFYNDASFENGSFIYRLKMVDLDNKFCYSNANQLILNCIASDQINLFPNPAINEITLTIKEDKDNIYTIKIVDVTGKIIYNEVYYLSHETKNIDFPIENFVNGIYSVIINNGSENKTIKLLKSSL